MDLQKEIEQLDKAVRRELRKYRASGSQLSFREVLIRIRGRDNPRSKYYEPRRS